MDFEERSFVKEEMAALDLFGDDSITEKLYKKTTSADRNV